MGLVQQNNWTFSQIDRSNWMGIMLSRQQSNSYCFLKKCLFQVNLKGSSLVTMFVFVFTCMCVHKKTDSVQFCINDGTSINLYEYEMSKEKL